MRDRGRWSEWGKAKVPTISAKKKKEDGKEQEE